MFPSTLTPGQKVIYYLGRQHTANELAELFRDAQQPAAAELCERYAAKAKALVESAAAMEMETT